MKSIILSLCMLISTICFGQTTEQELKQAANKLSSKILNFSSEYQYFSLGSKDFDQEKMEKQFLECSLEAKEIVSMLRELNLISSKAQWNPVQQSGYFDLKSFADLVYQAHDKIHKSAGNSSLEDSLFSLAYFSNDSQANSAFKGSLAKLSDETTLKLAGTFKGIETDISPVELTEEKEVEVASVKIPPPPIPSATVKEKEIEMEPAPAIPSIDPSRLADSLAAPAKRIPPPPIPTISTPQPKEEKQTDIASPSKSTPLSTEEKKSVAQQRIPPPPIPTAKKEEVAVAEPEETITLGSTEKMPSEKKESIVRATPITPVKKPNPENQPTAAASNLEERNAPSNSKKKEKEPRVKEKPGRLDFIRNQFLN